MWKRIFTFRSHFVSCTRAQTNHMFKMFGVKNRKEQEKKQSETRKSIVNSVVVVKVIDKRMRYDPFSSENAWQRIPKTVRFCIKWFAIDRTSTMLGGPSSKYLDFDRRIEMKCLFVPFDHRISFVVEHFGWHSCDTRTFVVRPPNSISANDEIPIQSFVVEYCDSILLVSIHDPVYR